ncbi:uncharacterized protein M6B38_176635 [Iris pallida]|uniref:RNase H type-1 domain-containing protein n=1 Tax=Iris pallida TaxID=29817 RepID=A0AAX6EPD9_IRIPA|nr:uncharacterized protein M6B38_176635 [Iris pallida]
MAPASGLMLNITGRIGDPPCTAGGGIIRDANGNFIGTLYFYLDEIDIVIPELEDLLYAATCCREKNWVINEVETSSQRLINIMLAKEAHPWALVYKLRKVRACLTPISVFQLVPSRANGVAKALASLAIATREGQIFSHASELPATIPSAIFADAHAS